MLKDPDYMLSELRRNMNLEHFLTMCTWYDVHFHLWNHFQTDFSHLWQMGFWMWFILNGFWSLWRSLVCVEGRGRISRSGLTQDIKMDSCVFQCDVPHQWIAQRQVGPVSVYCGLYTVTGWGVVSCVCGMTFLCGSTLVKVPLLQAGTVVIWPQMFQSDVKPTHKEALCEQCKHAWLIAYNVIKSLL